MYGIRVFRINAVKSAGAKEGVTDEVMIQMMEYYLTKLA